MKQLKLALLLSAAALTAFACATNTNTSTPTVTSDANRTAATPTATPDELAAARATFNATCVRCHKETGEGGEVVLEEGGKLKVPSFKSEHAMKESDAHMAKQIADGGDGMPAFRKRLEPDADKKINDLIRFIRREFQGGGAGVGAANANNSHAGAHD